MAIAIKEETRITFKVPINFGRLVKSYAGARGKTIKSLVMAALSNYIKNGQGDVQAENKNEYITEEQADLMLKPLIQKYINQIQEGTFEGRTLEEIETECKSS